MVTIYFVSLFISPQLWIEPFVGIRLDIYIYPIWFIYLIVIGKGGEILKFKVQDKMLVAFMVWLYITIILNDKNEFTQLMVVNYTKYFLIYRLISVTIDTSEAFKSTINRLILIVFIIVIEAIQHKYSSDGIGWAGQSLGWVDQSVLDAGGTGRTRWVNIFDGPGVFCVMFTLILPFVLEKLDSYFSFKTRLFYFILLLALLFAIWTTGSRGGFLATLVIFGAYGLSRMNISIGRMIKVGSVLGMVFMVAPSYLTSVKDENKSAQNRVDMWMEGVEMVQQNPILGIGRGNFASYTGSLIAHNSSIEIMGEMGFIGFYLWLSFIYLSIKTVMHVMVLDNRQEFKSYYRGLIICVIGYIANSMFVTLEYETFYFILALTRSLNRGDSDEITFDATDIKRVFYIAIGFIIFLKLFFLIY